MVSIEDLGATLTVGACFVAALVLIVDILLGTRFFIRIRGEGKRKLLGPLVLFIALSYAVGMMLETTSDYVVGNESKSLGPIVTWGLWHKSIFLSEKQLKAVVLYDRKKKRWSPLGHDLAESDLFQEYAGKTATEALEVFKEQFDPKGPPDQKFSNSPALSVYHRAKNRVMREDNYYSDLMGIQQRTDFARSFGFGSAILQKLLVLTFLLRVLVAPVRRRTFDRPSGHVIWLAFCMLLVLYVTYLIGMGVYQWEEKQFNKRVFGYCISLEADEGRKRSARLAASGTARFAASGMARLDASHYLVVNDTKKDETGLRLGVLRVLTGGPAVYRELDVNWDASGGPASDLESVCEVPASAAQNPRQFLAAESGKDGHRRLFRLNLHKPEHGPWVGEIVGVIDLPDLVYQIEGIACASSSKPGEFTLLLGQRDSNTSVGRLTWGTLYLDEQRFEFQHSSDALFSIEAPHLDPAADTRDCSDLYLDSKDRIWVSAATDGGYNGPFQSVIFQVAKFDRKANRPMKTPDAPQARWILDGVKVEAIAPFNGREPGCYATDDEGFGGIWRPLPIPP